MLPSRPVVTAKPFTRDGATVGSPSDSDDELSDSTAMAQPLAIPAPTAPTPLKLRRPQAIPIVSPASLSLPSLPKPEPESLRRERISSGLTSTLSTRPHGSCSLTLLQLPKAVFKAEQGPFPVRGSGLCAGLPGRSPVLGPAASSMPKPLDVKAGPVHVHAAPACVLLPFLDRPTEVKELLDQPVNAELTKRLHIAFRDESEWADIAKLLFECDRDEVPDEQWIRLLKRKVCPKAPDTWASLSSCLGADHLDLRGEDDEEVCNEERCAAYAWPTSGRRQSVRHDTWARVDEEDVFEDAFALSPTSSHRSSRTTAEFFHCDSPSSSTPALEVEVLHDLPASFRKPSGALKDTDISVMAQEDVGVIAHAPAHHMPPSSSSSGADLPDIVEEEAQPVKGMDVVEERGHDIPKHVPASSTRLRRVSTSLTSEPVEAVKQTMEMHRESFAALRIRTSSFCSATASTPPTPRSLWHSDTPSLLSSASSTPSPLLPPTALSSQCEIDESEKRITQTAFGPMGRAYPTPPFLKCRRLSQLAKPFVEDAPSKPHINQSSQTPGHGILPGHAPHGRRTKHVSIDPTPVELHHPVEVLMRRHSSGYQRRMPRSASSSNLDDTSAPLPSLGAPGVPPQARRRRSLARSFSELTPIVPSARRHTVGAIPQPPGSVLTGTERCAGDSSKNTARFPRRHTVGTDSQRPPVEEVAECEARGSPKPHDLGLLPDGRTRHPSAGAKGAASALAVFRSSLGLSPRDPTERKGSFGSSSGGGSQSSSRKPSIEHAATSRPALNKPQIGISTSSASDARIPHDGEEDPGEEGTKPIVPSPLAQSTSSQGSLPRTPRVHRREGGFSAFSREYLRYHKARARASSTVSEAFSSGSQAIITSDTDEDGSHPPELERSTPDLPTPPSFEDGAVDALGLVGVPDQDSARLVSDTTPRAELVNAQVMARPPSSADTHRSDDTAATSPGTLYFHPLSRSRSASEASAHSHAKADSQDTHRRTILVFPISPCTPRSEGMKRLLEDPGAQEALRDVEATIGADAMNKLREMVVEHERHEVDDAKLLEDVGDACFQLADLESKDPVIRQRAEVRACEDDYPRRWQAFERFCNDVCCLDPSVVAQARKRSGPATSLCAPTS